MTNSLLGVDKNTYVEPTIWTIEWAQHHYNYPQTRSNGPRLKLGQTRSEVHPASNLTPRF